MSAQDKAKNTAEKAAGKIKEESGKITGDESAEAEGKAEQAAGDLRERRRESKRRFQEVDNAVLSRLPCLWKAPIRRGQRIRHVTLWHRPAWDHKRRRLG